MALFICLNKVSLGVHSQQVGQRWGVFVFWEVTRVANEERRSGKERRTGQGRRLAKERRLGKERRSELKENRTSGEDVVQLPKK